MKQIPIFVINLDSSDRRLQEAEKQIHQQDLEFQRISAFDGRKLTPDQFPDYDATAAYRYMGRPLRGGEIGCYLSHLNGARHFLTTGAPAGIVLEDDLQLSAEFLSCIMQILSWLSSSSIAWDLINIGPRKKKICTLLHEFVINDQKYRLTHAHYFPMLTTGLIWSRDGARAFVDGHRRIAMPIDNYFRHWQTRRNRGLSVWPPLVHASGAESEIAGNGAERRSAAGQHPLYGLIKQRRLMGDKLIALRHKWQTRKP